MLKEVFQAEEKWYQMETQVYKKERSTLEMVNMWLSILKYFLFLISLKYIWFF